MYDFYFGTPAEIEADKEGFLLGVKRLLQRLGQPEDVAGMVNYLVSDSGNYITGQLFSVAGGE